jgi:serine/threonine protein kinase
MKCSRSHEIAEALETVHERGIVHRDLKPANVKVRDDGTVKVLDFELAKALGMAPPGSPRPYDILPDGRFVAVGAANQTGEAASPHI